MRKEDALEIFEAKLADIEQDHDAELAGREHARKPVDAKAEARALTAVFDFLESCKITPTESLLRVFRRYLRPTRTHTPITEQRRNAVPEDRGRAKASFPDIGRAARRCER